MRKIRVLLVDDENNWNNISPKIQQIADKGGLETATVQTLPKFLELMGITLSDSVFNGVISSEFDYDIVLLDWNLGSHGVPTKLNAFAFIPHIREHYKWRHRGEEVFVVAYSQVWDQLIASLEGYLMSLECQQRGLLNENEIMEVLTDKGFDIVRNSELLTIREVYNELSKGQPDLDKKVGIESGAEMKLKSIFAYLCCDIGQKEKLAGKVWLLLCQFSPLYVFYKEILCKYGSTYKNIMHGKPLNSKQQGFRQTAQDIITILEKEEFEAYGGQRFKLAPQVKEFLKSALTKLIESLPEVTNLQNNIKNNVRLRYGRGNSEYSHLRDIIDSDIEVCGAPDSGKWVSYIYIKDFERFLQNLDFQLRNGSGCVGIEIRENEKMAYWYFHQEGPVSESELGSMRNSGNWKDIRNLVSFYGELYVRAQGSWYRLSTGKLAAFTTDYDVQFALALPIFRV